MDIVIPLAFEPANHTLPLVRRSLALHAPQLRLVIAGYAWPYLNDPEVGHTIDFPQLAGREIANTDTAMRKACLDPEVSDPFIWSNDDIYWRRPVTLEELVHHSAVSRGPLPPASYTAKNIHTRIGKVTGELMRAAHLPDWDYERHVPLLVHKAAMLQALELGGSKRSTYGNLTNAFPTAIRPDVKVFYEADVAELASPELEPWFSTGNRFPVQQVPDMLGLGSVAATAGSQAS